VVVLVVVLAVVLLVTPFLYRGHGRVELYLYPHSGPHRSYNGITLPLVLLVVLIVLVIVVVIVVVVVVVVTSLCNIITEIGGYVLNWTFKAKLVYHSDDIKYPKVTANLLCSDFFLILCFP